jgi:hypothetical protein
MLDVEAGIVEVDVEVEVVSIIVVVEEDVVVEVVVSSRSQILLVLESRQHSSPILMYGLVHVNSGSANSSPPKKLSIIFEISPHGEKAVTVVDKIRKTIIQPVKFGFMVN